MKSFTLNEIALACGGQYVGDESFKNTEISSVERDSRNIKENSLFLAIKGERVDGHDFIEKCFESGALCALCEKAPENPSKPCIVVDSTLDAVKKVARAYREKFDIPIVGISGSVGKTSTKEMIAAVLSSRFNVHKTAGNLNNELGVPLTLFGMNENTEAAVIEMGISGFGEMTRISEMVQPTIEVITIIGECHLENLGDRDGVFKAKTEMFKNLREGGRVVLNGDDDKLSQVTEVKGERPIFYGLNGEAYTAENIKNNGALGVDADLILKGKRVKVTVPAIGTYMVANALAGAAVGELLGLDTEEIKKGVESYRTVGSRANLVDTGYIRIVDDCYNANPTSVKASIDTLLNLGGRSVALLGDMKELGKNELALHREVGEYARKCDLVIAVGPLAQALAEGAGGVHFVTKEDAMESLPRLIHEGDTVLVKASHSMQFEKLVEFLKELK